MSDGDAVSIDVPAFAKINLYLHVTGRRPDGYHLLDSLVAFAGIGDLIEARFDETVRLTVGGPYAADVPDGPDNLVLRAAHRLAAAGGVTAGAALHLTKRLPVASGMGGGSADAAAALKALARLWDLRPADGDLAALALDLGADVPVCLKGRGAFMGGIGEDIVDCPPLPDGCWVVLANPGVALSTAEVFRRRDGGFSGPGRFEATPADAAELAEILNDRRNDLTNAAVALAPPVAAVLADLAASPGALMARMTGSGATCFALFASMDAATDAAAALQTRHPDWWVAPAPLGGDTDAWPREFAAPGGSGG